MTVRLGFLFCALALSTLAAAEPLLSVKAKTEEPVLEELLGGCSLRCAFRWTVEAQSAPAEKPKLVKVLNDESAQTAWMAPDTSGGVGAKFVVRFPKKLRAEMEGATPFYGLDLINGFWKTDELWEQHARLKKVRLSYNGKPFRDVLFADSRRWQRLTFPDFFIKSGDTLTLEVLEVYPGKGGPLAITELVLQGGH